MCFTDTFVAFAAVYDSIEGLIGIDREENILFHIFPYDNGPDYISEEKFRIISENKIGYANTKGQIIIEPRFPCAFPFRKNKAKVSLSCEIEILSEHGFWVSENWFFIDTLGNPIK